MSDLDNYFQELSKQAVTRNKGLREKARVLATDIMKKSLKNEEITSEERDFCRTTVTIEAGGPIHVDAKKRWEAFISKLESEEK